MAYLLDYMIILKKKIKIKNFNFIIMTHFYMQDNY